MDTLELILSVVALAATIYLLIDSLTDKRNGKHADHAD